MKDPRTLSVYDSEAADYAELVETDKPNPRLEAFFDALPENGRVLDLGCGPGTWTARMKARGLVVDAMDASEGMARVARERYGVEVQLAGFDALDAHDHYDGIWAHFSLLHAARADFPRHLAAIARALRPGGVLLLAMKLGNGEARDGKDRFYSYYTEAELMTLLEAAGLVPATREIGEEVGLAGTKDPFIVLHATHP